MKELLQPRPEQVVPRVKRPEHVAGVRELTGQEPVFEPFVGDLVIAYAFDSPAAFRLMMASDLDELGVERSDLFHLAMANLMSLGIEIEIRGAPPILGLETGGDLEACMLLLGDLWDQLAEKIPGEIVIAAPRRDVVLISSSETPGALREMASIAADIVSQDKSPHALSALLFVWRGGGWEVFPLPEKEESDDCEGGEEEGEGEAFEDDSEE